MDTINEPTVETVSEPVEIISSGVLAGKQKRNYKRKPQSLEQAMRINPSSMTNVDAQSKFFKSLAITSDVDGSGHNDFIHHFMRVSWLLLTSYRHHTFDVNTVINLLKFLDTSEVPKVISLFEKWVKLMIALGIVEQLPTCMDTPIYKLI